MFFAGSDDDCRELVVFVNPHPRTGEGALAAGSDHDCKGLVVFVNPHPRPVLSEIEGPVLLERNAPPSPLEGESQLSRFLARRIWRSCSSGVEGSEAEVSFVNKRSQPRG